MIMRCKADYTEMRGKCISISDKHEVFEYAKVTSKRQAEKLTNQKVGSPSGPYLSASGRGYYVDPKISRKTLKLFDDFYEAREYANELQRQGKNIGVWSHPNAKIPSDRNWG